MEIDAVCDGQDVFIPGIMQHIEKAGIHSGDSIFACPHYNLSDEIINEILKVTRTISVNLGVIRNRSKSWDVKECPRYK